MDTVSEVSIVVRRLLAMETEMVNKINLSIEEILRLHSNPEREREVIKSLINSIQYSLENAETALNIDWSK